MPPNLCRRFPRHLSPPCPALSRFATVTSVNSSLLLGYGIQGDVGLPGDPGQPMINGVVEFVGFPKGDKGMQVCWKNATLLMVDICNTKQDDQH